MFASRKIIDRFGYGGLDVAESNSRGKNPFPKDWRMHAFYVDALPILNESGKIVTPVADKPAHLHLIDTVRATEEKTTLLFTGPLTDLARALDEAPEIEEKIERLVWMGGTFREAGNVHEPEHDGTAEWNVFWDPEAAGPSQGRTEETTDGRPVNVVYDVNRDAFFDYITELAKKA